MAQILTLIVLFAALAATPVRAAEEIAARVVALGSGSAIAVLDPQEKLRRVKLAGVDAPEKTQRFGEDALRLASQWLSGRSVPVETLRVDDDGRLRARIVVDGEDVGLALLAAGLAWCDPSDIEALTAQARSSYQEACAKARAQRLGLWRDPHPVAPWEHRRIPQFKPLPGAPAQIGRHCRLVRPDELLCDDGASFRALGDRIYGPDGVVYLRNGEYLRGTDGSVIRQDRGEYRSSDGTICRQRGRHVSCP